MLCNFKYDQLHDLVSCWYTDGQLLSQIHYKNGIKNGYECVWSKDGILLRKYCYHYGKLNGIGIEWWENGNGVRETWRNGTLYQQIFFSNGKYNTVCC